MRNINAELLANLNSNCATVAFLLKIQARDGSTANVTSLDIDFDYDDGNGELTYSSIIGLEESAIETSAELNVDNAEAKMLLVDAGDITREKIQSGMLDFARYTMYVVNYKKPRDGHFIPPGGTGYIGIAKVHDELQGVLELRSLAQWAKQTFNKFYSKTCLVPFGGAKCGFDVSSLWLTRTVASVGTETDRVFTANAAPVSSGYEFVPGVVLWTSGDNTGRTVEIEAVNGAEITLQFATRYAIQDSDGFKIRPDCDKRLVTCRDTFNNLVNLRGTPLIPLGDESSQVVPGAAAYPAHPRFGQYTIPETTPIP